MAASITSAEFTDDTRLFYSRQSANTWRLGLRCPSAGTSSEGAVKQCTHVADIATVGGDSGTTAVTAGASVSSDPTTIPTIGDAYDVAEIKAAFKQMAEKINYLTYRLEQAGLMKNS